MVFYSLRLFDNLVKLCKTIIVIKKAMSRIDQQCLAKSVIWFVSNAIFGAAPLLFLIVINPLLNRAQAAEEIHVLMRGGSILFVCCALMGAVVIDILQDKLVVGRIFFFFLNITPFITVSIICLFYVLNILNHLRQELFTTFSFFYFLVIGITVLYCTLCKYLLFHHNKKSRL